MNKSSIKLSFFLFSLTFFYFSNVKCQYYGGNEDGVDIGQSCGANLSGNITQTSIIYFGSFDEGSTYKTYFSLINGDEINIYSGGKNDGVVSNHMTFALAGENLNKLYKGNLDEGSTNSVLVSLSPSGVNASSLYSGGFNDGHVLKPYSNFLFSMTPLSMYSGGSDDGYSIKSGYGIIASSAIKMFNGNSDEGSTKVKYQGPLDLTSQNLLYNGGEDDGFILTIESALILSGTNNVNEENITNTITLYPNPLTGTELYVKFQKGISKKDIQSIMLFSVTGQAYPLDYSFADKNIKISLQNQLKRGGYIITVNTSSGEMIKIKFIAQ